MRCENCRELLLDHLYDLLDTAEADAVDAHLATCPECAAARDRASRDQSLFASAAKASFPNVRFAPPFESAVPAPTAPAASPSAPSPAVAPNPGRRWYSISSLVGWGVAASLLLAIPTIPNVLRQYQDQATVAMVNENDARSRRDLAQQQLSLAGSDVREAAKETPSVRLAQSGPLQADLDRMRKLPDNLKAQAFKQLKDIAQQEKKQKLSVDVVGPAAIQPGAPNDYTIVIHDRQETKGLKQIEAMVRDDKDRVLFRQPLDHEKRGDRHEIKLPASIWTDIKPETDLFLVVATVDSRTNIRSESEDKVRLLGPVYSTLLTTDKPLYRPGERLFFRSLTLDRTSFRAPDREQELSYELRDPQGNLVPGMTLVGTTNLVRTDENGESVPVLGPDGKPVRGVGSGAFDLPESLASGEYTLRVAELRHPAGYVTSAPATRKITVKPFSTDRFQKKLEFGAASFQGGDTVAAWCEVQDLGQPVAGAMVTPTVIADGHVLNLPAVETGADGKANFRFALPGTLEIGDAKLRADVRIGDVSENLTRRIPVIGRRLNVEFFPEGGNLVAGVPCRVYLRATSPLGAPVDVRGVVTNGREVVANIETFTDAEHPGANRGLGSFTFTPKLGAPYWLKLEKPAGANEPLRIGPVPTVPSAVVGAAAVAASRTGFLLPKAESDGVVMWVPKGVNTPGDPIVVQLWSVGKPRSLVVGAYTRGRLLDTKSITVAPGKPSVVHLAGDANPRGGVTRVTVFEQPPATAANRDLQPVAERLVYRVPTEELKLSLQVTPDVAGGDSSYFNGSSPANLAIRASDESGQPTAALLYAAVVDANSAAMSDSKRERLLTTHFLLAGEVQKPDDLEYVDFLLTNTPQAAQALDLLLGTQGWRRFAEQAGGQMNRRHNIANADLEGLVMLTGQTPVEVPTLGDLRKQQTFSDFVTKYNEAVHSFGRFKTLGDAPVAAAAAPAATVANPERSLTPLREAVTVRQAEYDARAAEAAARSGENREARRWAGYGLWIAGGIAALLLLAAGFVRPWSRRLPFAVGGAAAIALAVVLAFATDTIAPPQATFNNASPPAAAEKQPPSKRVAADDSRKLTEAKEAAAEKRKQLAGTETLAAERPAPASDPVPTFKAHEKQATPTAEPEMKRSDPVVIPPPAALVPPAPVPPPAALVQPEPVPPPAVTPVMTPRPSIPTPMAPPGPMNAAIAPKSAVPGGPNLSVLSGKDEKGLKPGYAAAPPKEARGGSLPFAGGLGGSGSAPQAAFGTSKGSAAAADSLQRDGKFEAQGTDAAVGARSYGTISETIAQGGRARGLLLKRDEAGTKLNKALDESDRSNGLPARTRKGADKGESMEFMRRAVPASDQERLGAVLRNSGAADVSASLESLLQVPPLVVREYAPLRPAADRDLALEDGVLSLDTIFWQPLIVVPGEGTVTFPIQANADAAGYEVIVAGHTLNGRLGAVRRIVPVLPAPSK